MTPAEIRAELQRRAGDTRPVTAYAIDGIVHDAHEDADSFCEPCAETLAEKGGEVVLDDSEGDDLRWCSECGALLDWRIVGTEGVINEIAHHEETPPTKPEHWAELSLAMAEIPPEDWRTAEDGPVDPSPLWTRVERILMATEEQSR